MPCSTLWLKDIPSRLSDFRNDVEEEARNQNCSAWILGKDRRPHDTFSYSLDPHSPDAQLRIYSKSPCDRFPALEDNPSELDSVPSGG